MNIELKEIKVSDLTKGYQDNEEDGVIDLRMRVLDQGFDDGLMINGSPQQ